VPGSRERTDSVDHVVRPQTNFSPFVLIKGAGEMASAIAWRLYMANIRSIVMLELENPLAVRRQVSFCPALETGRAVVEGVGARAARDRRGIQAAWTANEIAVVLVDDWRRIEGVAPDVVVDAILAKRNLGTRKDDAPLVIALGPGFEAGRDAHLVVETNRGHDLGRIIEAGSAEENTGVPGAIAGRTSERVLRAPAAGTFTSERAIGDIVRKGDVIGSVAGRSITAETDGVLRGLIRSGTEVRGQLKVGDIDPRAKPEYCTTISDKARALSGSVLECVMRRHNRPLAKPAGN